MITKKLVISKCKCYYQGENAGKLILLIKQSLFNYKIGIPAYVCVWTLFGYSSLSCLSRLMGASPLFIEAVDN